MLFGLETVALTGVNKVNVESLLGRDQNGQDLDIRGTV